MRRARIIVAFALIGAALTVLSSWACALWSPIHTRIQPNALANFNDFKWGVNNISTDLGVGYRAHHLLGARGADDHFKQWSGQYESTRSFGWPVRALGSHVQAYRAPSGGDALQGWDLPLTELFRRGYPTNELPAWLHAQRERRLPFVPLWPGFLVNSLIYATLAWAFIALFSRIRQRSRVRRGLCPKCKYNLASIPTCPECNTPAPFKASTT